ncbi:MAG: hypothetical protein ACOYN4_03385 [Bacteroidales bacterium]
MYPQSASGLNGLLIILRIGLTIYCVKRAKTLGRDKWSWGVFAFFLPLIAFIAIQFMKPRVVWHNYPINQTEEQNRPGEE